MGSVVGEMRALSPDTLWLRIPSEPRFSIDRGLIERLQVSTGKGGHAGVGALIGFGVGLVVTSVLVASNTTDASNAAYFGAGLLYFGLPGALLGAGIGALATTDRWKDVPLPPRPR
jgi:hypothetical protein